jgi:hypothetical protein
MTIDHNLGRRVALPDFGQDIQKCLISTVTRFRIELTLQANQNVLTIVTVANKIRYALSQTRQGPHTLSEIDKVKVTSGVLCNRHPLPKQNLALNLIGSRAKSNNPNDALGPGLSELFPPGSKDSTCCPPTRGTNRSPNVISVHTGGGGTLLLLYQSTPWRLAERSAWLDYP